VYAVTLPGFDGRPIGAAADSTDLMQRAADDLARLVSERRLEHPVIVGHSLGGTLAVLFGATHPADAAAIIAVEGGYPVAPTVAERTARVSTSTSPYQHATPATLGDSLRLKMLQYVITNPADVDSVTKYASRSDPGAVATWMRAALMLDLTPQLAAVRAPLLEIVPFDSDIDPYVGFKTPAIKHDAYVAWLAKAPHGSAELIEHSRHFVMLDQPVAFDALLFAAVHDYAEPH
jgi:pimeloyl-ACP methyl ester carboxylesterase